MLDFLTISTRTPKKDVIEIYPKFKAGKSSDLMIRGGDFYAIWNEEKNLWSLDEDVAIALIDQELDNYAKQHKDSLGGARIMHLWDTDSGMIDKWHKYVQKQLRDNYHPLDENLIFSNMDTKKTDYATKKLLYPLEAGECNAYEELISTLYNPPERRKIEWAIGSIVSGDSKSIQKFIVMYGSAGTGKSTVLNIIQDLFDGYYSVFDAKALGSPNNSFALEAFKSNPLVSIQHDGDLSRIEDNTRLNSVVSHELMTVNEKFKSTYSNRFNCFLFMGTNKPVRITDAKSGILRRLIDVSPSGKKIPIKRYKALVSQIKFELGAIASKCLDVYKEDPGYYDDYIPVAMLGASNDFYNFVLDSYDVFKREDGITLKQAWEMYKTYCTDANVLYPFSQRIFKEELKNYFKEFEERTRVEDESRVRNYYSGFLSNKFDYEPSNDNKETTKDFISFESKKSIFDEIASKYPAQYASSKETPLQKWTDVTTKLSDLDTKKLHYVRVPKNHIVIDFDIKDKSGKKSFQKNLEEVQKWPPTYGELSKSGEGIHLHYIYDGDPENLSRLYSPDIEIKVFTGKSSLRRKLVKCNELPIATINSGLPLKGDKKVVNFDAVQSEKGLRSLLIKNLKKEIHPGTKPSVDFIFKILDDAYKSDLKYDVTDMRPDVLAFASKSTNHADYCIKLVNKMQFKSEEVSLSNESKENKILFYDVEVFPNLFIVVWKAEGEDQKPVKMINPSPTEIENLLKFNLIGFNCRRYDNHILYARLMGYNNLQLYNQSQRIINGSKNAFFGEAYNISYADVYDFSSKKQSLKKFEIDLGIHHQELGMKWDEPVPEDKWDIVADYCINDVIATEAVFNDRKQDFIARKMLADLSGLSINDTTRIHTTKIIFGDDKKPPLVYTDLSTIFPGYEFKDGKSFYEGEEPGEGGYVYAEPGMYGDVALLDIASMHPTSIIELNLFGPYTERFKEIVEARLAIKHKDLNKAKKLLGGVLNKYLDNKDQLDALASALKIVINSVYGYTTANFENPFRDVRNKDNIVAKRGALFMINLKKEVQKRGYTVAHIKTDSIKIPDANKEIIDFIIDYGKKYGYNFDHEATYDRMCLVNDAVYIAKYKDNPHWDNDYKKELWWTATGTQFKVPYIFKKLFIKEPIVFNDMCETKSVSSYLYLDMNENLNEGDHNYIFVGKTGRFCPIKEGCGGGILLREKDGKYYAATGSKGYRWLESEMVSTLKKEDDIDESYYIKLLDDAISTINEYGDYEWFVSDDPYVRAPFIAGKITNVQE